MPASHQIEEHIPRLRRYARALTGNTANADDLVQDTLERALSRFSLWRPGSDLRAWLFSIMHNVHINQVTSRRAKSEQPLDDDAPEIPVAATHNHVLEVRDLTQALKELPDEQREVVLLVGHSDQGFSRDRPRAPGGGRTSRLHARSQVRGGSSGGGRTGDGELAQQTDGRADRHSQTQRSGLSIVGGRLLPGGEGAACQIMYQNSEGKCITLYMSMDDCRSCACSGRPAGRDSCRVLERYQIGYAVSGDLPESELLKIANDVSRQL